MNEGIRTLVVLDAVGDPGRIESLVTTRPELNVIGFMDGLDEGWTQPPDIDCEVIVLACGASSDTALAFIDGAIKQKPGRPVVVVTEGSPNGFFKRAFEAGADDIVPLPEVSDQTALPALAEVVGFAVQKAVVRKRGTPGAGDGQTAAMVCVLGPKGGTGKTVTAVNMAVAAAEHGRNVVLIDLDLQFGDIGLSMALPPDKTIYDLARSHGSLDAEKAEAYLVRHESGVGVLLAPTRPDHASAITVEFLRELFAALRTIHELVIVDTPPSFAPEVIAAIDSASDICMVGTLDTPGIKSTKLGLETLALMGHSPDQVRLVLNRADSNVGISGDDVVAVIGRQPDVFVPSHRDIVRSVNSGTPIVAAEPRAEASRAFRALAAMYLPVVATNGAESSERRSRRRRRKG